MEAEVATTRFQFPWILWYHDPENKDYSLASYVSIADVATPQQFWTLVDSIHRDAWESGMFFFMRRGFKPMWESPEHEAGGSWSKKLESSLMYDTFIDLMAHCVCGTLLTSKGETLAGITVSPKGPFSIIKIWNTSTAVHERSYLTNTIKNMKIGDDVTYTAHKSRPK